MDPADLVDVDDLVARWERLAAAVGVTAGPGWEALGRRLLDAYGDERRAYHDLRHLGEVLQHVDELAAAAPHADVVRLAAWFHDAVYEGGADDEERSACLAEEQLPRFGPDPSVVASVARLVRLTASHDPGPDDADGAVLCDADLAVLARDEPGYRAYVDAVRREYAHVPDADFRRGRAAVLDALLAQPALFRTATARERWEATARRNVTAELARLRE